MLEYSAYFHWGINVKGCAFVGACKAPQRCHLSVDRNTLDQKKKNEILTENDKNGPYTLFKCYKHLYFIDIGFWWWFYHEKQIINHFN